MFIGGVTFAEISALRFLESQVCLNSHLLCNLYADQHYCNNQGSTLPIFNKKVETECTMYFFKHVRIMTINHQYIMNPVEVEIIYELLFEH